ncbi:MAG: hypothetical protein LUC93_03170 [Planctomycetaceae bacterium]|nr:hypothetical protein [Planctomycetaceae bacterium]
MTMPDQASKRAAEEINALIKAAVIESIRVWAKDNEKELEGFEMTVEVPGSNVDHLAAIIKRHMGEELFDLQERARALYEALKLSIQDEEMWACKYCGEIIHWDKGHADKGCIWSCEVCGDTFCAQCAKERTLDVFESDDVKCPDCHAKEAASCRE